MTAPTPSDPLKPSAALLSKLGSVIVHFLESQSEKGHQFDMIALEALLKDPEVLTWLQEMNAMSMLPVRR